MDPQNDSSRKNLINLEIHKTYETITSKDLEIMLQFINNFF